MLIGLLIGVAVGFVVGILVGRASPKTTNRAVEQTQAELNKLKDKVS